MIIEKNNVTLHFKISLNGIIQNSIEMELQIYNTLSRKKEIFKPINAPHVGLYVCGPTVYGDAHLGHARPAITFDILFRFLTFWDTKYAMYVTSPTLVTLNTMPTREKTR